MAGIQILTKSKREKRELSISIDKPIWYSEKKIRYRYAGCVSMHCV